MNKFFILTLIATLLCGSGVLHAQDIITLRSGEKLKVYIEEITPTEVKCKIYGNFEGPTYTIEKYKISKIQYGDGDGKTAQYRTPDPNYLRKIPGLSWLASFLIPGMGQFLNGDGGAGAGFLVGNIVGYSIMLPGAFKVTNEEGIDNGMVFLGGAIVVATWIGSQIDAYKSATNKNRANGYFSWNLNRSGTNLALQPEFKLTPVAINQGIAYIPTCGIVLKLGF